MLASIQADTRLRWAGIISVLCILVVALLGLNPVHWWVGGPLAYWIYTVLVWLAALAGAILSSLLWRSFGKGEPLRIIWALVALGLWLWLVAEIVFAVYDVTLGDDAPYPSLADAAWLLGYIPFFVAFWLRYRSLRVSPEPLPLAIILGVVLVMVVLSAVFVFTPIIADIETGSRPEGAVNVAYPVGDLVLALGALFSVLALSGGQLSRPWVFVAAGFVVVAIADLLYGYGAWNGLYLNTAREGYNLLTWASDIPYFSSYVLMAFGVFMQARLQKVM